MELDEILFAVVSYLYQTYNLRCMKVYTYFLWIISHILVMMEAREELVESMVIEIKLKALNYILYVDFCH